MSTVTREYLKYIPKLTDKKHTAGSCTAKNRKPLVLQQVRVGLEFRRLAWPVSGTVFVTIKTYSKLFLGSARWSNPSIHCQYCGPTTIQELAAFWLIYGGAHGPLKMIQLNTELRQRSFCHHKGKPYRLPKRALSPQMPGDDNQ